MRAPERTDDAEALVTAAQLLHIMPEYQAIEISPGKR
jgi:hypothetical protein